MEYTVNWEMVIDGDSPIDAVIQAISVMQDPCSTASHFTVHSEEGDVFEINASCRCCTNIATTLSADNITLCDEHASKRDGI